MVHLNLNACDIKLDEEKLTRAPSETSLCA